LCGQFGKLLLGMKSQGVSGDGGLLLLGSLVARDLDRGSNRFGKDFRGGTRGIRDVQLRTPDQMPATMQLL